MGCVELWSGGKSSFNKEMKRALVTGAGGYVGQHLCLALLANGWRVRGFGRSSRPVHLDGIEWVSGDILDTSMVDRAVAGSDVVIHLACQPLEQSEQDPLRALRINIEGAVNLLEATRRSEIERFIFTSTCQVYGGHGTLPNKESDLPHPGSVYAASKFSAEIWCESYRTMYQLPVQVLRLFNVYGPSVEGSPRSTVETIFLQQVRQGQNPTLRGNPQSGRDFIHIQDVIRAILLALGSPICEGPVNIGTGVLTTIKELAYLVARVLDKSIEPKIVESDDTAICFQADIKKASRLGFRAHVGLENGLRQLAQDYVSG